MKILLFEIVIFDINITIMERFSSLFQKEYGCCYKLRERFMYDDWRCETGFGTLERANRFKQGTTPEARDQFIIVELHAFFPEFIRQMEMKSQINSAIIANSYSRKSYNIEISSTIGMSNN